MAKTAAGTFDRTVEWTLDKSVEHRQATTALPAGRTSTWTVVATKTETLGNYEVTGTITIDNPAAVSQSFTVTDELNDGTVAAVDCDSGTAGNQASGTIPADGSVTCQYTALPADDSATSNTATVSIPGNPDETATAAVSFTENLIGDDSVTVDDDRDTEDQFPDVISSTGRRSTTAKTFPCSCPVRRTLHELLAVPTRIREHGDFDRDNNDLSDSASVTVNCSLPPGECRRHQDRQRVELGSSIRCRSPWGRRRLDRQRRDPDGRLGRTRSRHRIHDHQEQVPGPPDVDCTGGRRGRHVDVHPLCR